MFYTTLLICGLYLLVDVQVFAQTKIKEPLPVGLGKDGKLLYIPDSLGNRIIDFSHSGYEGGNFGIPDVPIKVIVPVKSGDATGRIQSALDYVASLPLDQNNFRGAVLLEKGIHSISGSLLIAKSGVVLKGSGAGREGTILFGAGKTRETMITVAGVNDFRPGKEISILEDYVPVNATTFKIQNAELITKGDRVRIKRPSIKAWIQALEMEEFGGETEWLGWKPGQHELVWDRIVTSVSGSQITIDVPITTALEKKYGGGFISAYEWKGRISHVGVENLSLESSFDETNLKDEDHRWMGLTFGNIENGWVRQVNFKNLAGSAVALYETASKVTVEDCKSLNPVSEIGGQRRYTFFTQGQQTLFQRCYAEYGYHDFSTGFCTAGPNAFVQCESRLPYNFSGTIDSWASGVLFDIVNVDGNALSFKNRGQDGHGAGWTAANSVFWQCSASKMENFSPPAARNFAFGSWSQFAGDGYWENVNEHIQPRSLYYAQLAERLSKDVSKRAFLMPTYTEASSSPMIEQAADLSASSSKPALQLPQWIDEATNRRPIAIMHNQVRAIDEIGIKNVPPKKYLPPLEIKNGWLVRGTEIVTGNRQEVPWWRGSLRPNDISAAKPHITRFVPGKNGNGLTDNPDEMTDSLLVKNITILDHNYGIWYDRRRDDHERIRRIDGDVWPPFYEQPFARSGVGKAWDNLSKYDLTKYNVWYWDRLHQFVDLADKKGLVLFHQNYFQHNILEAGAHYADFPWRPANNINNTGFPEPPPYAGDKRIFMADQFYDIGNPVRKELHKSYIRKCLDNFVDQSGVIQFISSEYTGPLHFVKFWLDVIADWEKEKGKNALVALSTTKDVQDEILSDPAYAGNVDIIDIRYWNKKEDGTYYAPAGGKSLAPRQHARIQKTGKVSFDAIYQTVLEYRLKYPEKPVLYSSAGYDTNAWAVFFAGGSLSGIPKIASNKFISDILKMQVSVSANGQYGLVNPGQGMIAYQPAGEIHALDLTKFKGKFLLTKIDSKTGKILEKTAIVPGGNVLSVPKPVDNPIILWLSKM
ncbi:hypothetical protein SAMN04487995_4081 [Dyadobacter koreensis]|uniref:DUF6298 domain-containing protein n=1 Tax=Dyadobacter koreensis TaxID=408657 RepID=A0A1H6XMH4_9BACT|nr:DUF6298 domain-containing protein [Dyadobacter koreensis]SEJ30288.1 hypothetical protein SAMN04487995_4081 [Dyadobacter koreensis]